ncbi:D-alanyl-D-alanine carboxypeptidase family protein [soil metagenome]
MIASAVRRALFSLSLLLALTAPVAAQDAAYESTAREAILLDAKSGTVFYEKGADTPVPPASMSKLMTVILVIEALKAGKITMDTEIPITEDAWRRGGAMSGGSTMYAELNSKVKLSDLIQGIIVQSANDACIAVATALAGSEAAFAERMTERARALGLQKAVFRNSTGLPDPEHLMSVRELAMLARHIISTYPEYYKYYSEPSFTWNKITQQNRNPLLIDYPGADGMKTGYTKEAGYGLVGSAVRDNRRLILVISGLPSLAERKKEAQRLLDWGFKQFRPVTAYAANDRVSRARIWGGTEGWVDLVTRSDIRILLSPAEQDRVEASVLYTGPLIAPVSAGQQVGKLRITVDGRPISEFPVETANSVAAVDSIWRKAIDSVKYMILGG